MAFSHLTHLLSKIFQHLGHLVPFVLITLAPRYISAAEVNLFFLLETILGPLWVWMVIKEQPSNETIIGGIVIIGAIATHSILSLKKT